MRTSAHIRDLKAFGALSKAEQKLCDESWSPDLVTVSDSCPDADAGDDLQIRADFLRYVILKGYGEEKVPLHETGVQLFGARITGQLDLQGCDIPQNLNLKSCHFDQAPFLLDAKLRGLYLEGSTLPGLLADRLRTAGNVHLQKVTASGEIRLLGAKLGGNLDCVGATLEAHQGGKALHADGLDTQGGVFLRDVTAKGKIRLLGAKLGGDLVCINVKPASENANVTLSCDRMRAEGTFFLGNCRFSGPLSLAGAHVAALSDRTDSWPETGLLLDRFTYDAIIAGPTDAKTRIGWLKKQYPHHLDEEFKPQPWEHCAKVLREMGHAKDAREILIEKEKLQRRARRETLRRGLLFEDAYWRGICDFLLGWTVRYGRQPTLAFAWLGVVWLIGLGVFSGAWTADAFKPNNAFVLRAPEWVLCGEPKEVQVLLGHSPRQQAQGRSG